MWPTSLLCDVFLLLATVATSQGTYGCTEYTNKLWTVVEDLICAYSKYVLLAFSLFDYILENVVCKAFLNRPMCKVSGQS